MQLFIVEDWQCVQVQLGQIFLDIFVSLGLGMLDLQWVMDLVGSVMVLLYSIWLGQEFDFLLVSDGSLSGICFDCDQVNWVMICFDDYGVKFMLQLCDMDKCEYVVYGMIDSLLYVVGVWVGMSVGMVGKFVDLFKYDIDFVQDLCVGDSFIVIYDDIYCDGSYYIEGDIVVVEFVNQGYCYMVYCFKKVDGSVGWFSEDGWLIQKLFLCILVDFICIFLQFSVGCMYLIFGCMCVYKGVDYVVFIGMLIYVVGDGVIKYCGWMNGYGNFVIIQYNGIISIVYGYMLCFVVGECIGQYVCQGQVIGYVGMIGLVIGLYLYYEFCVNGVQCNLQIVMLFKFELLLVV